MQRLQRFAPAFSHFLNYQHVRSALSSESNELLARSVSVVDVGKYQLHAVATSTARRLFSLGVPGGDRGHIYRHAHRGNNRPAQLSIKKARQQTGCRTDQILNFEVRRQLGVFAQMTKTPSHTQQQRKNQDQLYCYYIYRGLVSSE